MASEPKTVVTFLAVIKGYHVYRNKLNDATQYECIPEPDNCLDKHAVVVKDTANGAIVGHVPALPVKLNHAVLNMLKLDKTLQVFCRATDRPYPSSHPWPQPQSKGGGVVVPVEFQVLTLPVFEVQVLGQIEAVFAGYPELYETLSVSVKRPGESTPPPMQLSTEPGLPDTPQFAKYTP